MKKTSRLRKISVFTINVNKITKKYDNIAESIHMKHKCQWYEKGERSSTFFLDLEEFTLKLIQICKITVNVKEAPDLDKIQYDIDFFYLFLKRVTQKRPPKLTIFLVRFNFQH